MPANRNDVSSVNISRYMKSGPIFSSFLSLNMASPMVLPVKPIAYYRWQHVVDENIYRIRKHFLCLFFFLFLCFFFWNFGNYFEMKCFWINNKFKIDNLLVKALIKAIRKRRINEIVIIIAVISYLFKSLKPIGPDLIKFIKNTL